MTTTDPFFEINGLSAMSAFEIIVQANFLDCAPLQDTIVCTTLILDADLDGFGEDVDCDDNNPLVYPGASEACDGLDNNCNDQVDEGLTFISYFLDADGDGFGDAQTERTSCEVLAGYVTDGTDCDDNNAMINPGAAEACDEIDNNCNNEVDEGLTFVSFFLDVDGDGYGDAQTERVSCVVLSGYVMDGTDCDDNNASVNPGSVETCDGLDNNCNNEVDEGLTFVSFFLDMDGDGYGDPQTERISCVVLSGYVMDSTDCDDTNAMINPDAAEACDGLDNNCNNEADEGLTFISYFLDADGDGYGDAQMELVSCEVPAGYVTDSADCDDSNAMVNPGAVEACDGLDNNCSGQADEGLVFISYFLDADGDGYGDAQMELVSCEVPSGYVTDDTDCDDSNAMINPSAIEIVNNGVDEDCDGQDLVSGIHDLGQAVLRIFPNPVSDILYIHTDRVMDLEMTLYDMKGNWLHSYDNKTSIDLREFPDGTYLLSIQDKRSSQQVVEKITIVK